MSIRATDIHSVTDFTRHAREFIEHIRATKSPMVLTVNGDAQVVVQDAESYQKMADELEHARFIAAMRESEVEARNGQSRPADQVFDEIRERLGLPRRGTSGR